MDKLYTTEGNVDKTFDSDKWKKNTYFTVTK